MSKENLSVAEAERRITDATSAVGCELVTLEQAFARILAEDAFAELTSPAFAVSAMDGYAVRSADVKSGRETLEIIGESAAGGALPPPLQARQAMRIFTGAALPPNADTVIIQESTKAQDKNLHLQLSEVPPAGDYVRAPALDFKSGDKLAQAGTILTARHIALLAAGGHLWLKVRRRPKMLILSGGNELVMPGNYENPGQVIAGNALSLRNFATLFGASAEILPIAEDNRDSLKAAVENLHGADVLVSSGGASVGDYDLIRPILGECGLKLDFYKIAMRPGKPMMFGRLHDMAYLGLPGNPVSVLVCAAVFLRPLLLKLGGADITPLPSAMACLAADLPQEGARQHYMRALITQDKDGTLWAEPMASQDSSVLSALAEAQAFIVRPPQDSAKAKGDKVKIIFFPTSLQTY